MRQTAARAGTSFHKLRTPLVEWFLAMPLLTSANNDIPLANWPTNSMSDGTLPGSSSRSRDEATQFHLQVRGAAAGALRVTLRSNLRCRGVTTRTTAQSRQWGDALLRSLKDAAQAGAAFEPMRSVGSPVPNDALTLARSRLLL